MTVSMDTKTFVKTINSLRLANKNKWYWYKGEVNNKLVNVKGFNTWLQVLVVDGIDHSAGMDISVAEFKRALTEAAEYDKGAKSLRVNLGLEV